MKSPSMSPFAPVVIAAMLAVFAASLLHSQDPTTTAEEAAISAAEAAMDTAWEADKAAFDAERDAEMNGSRAVDVERASILRKRADELAAAFLAALAKAEEALAKVPSADAGYYQGLNERMNMMRRLKDVWTTPPPTETGSTDKQQSLASGGIFGDFNGDGKQDLVGKVASITGTGETIGHIADITLMNSSDQKVTLTIPPTVLSSVGGQYQPYLVPKATHVTLAPNSTKLVPLDGVCLDGRKPPVGSGVSGELVLLNPAAPNFPRKYSAQLAGGQRIIAATSALQNAGRITTPFSGNPEKERETIIQQTIWIYTASMNRKPYTKEEFANKLYSLGGFQPPNDLTPPVPLPTTTVAKTNPPSVTTSEPVTTPKAEPSKTDAPPDGPTPAGSVVTTNPVVTKAGRVPTDAEKKKLDAGVDQFWDAFQLTGKEAKILD